MKFGELVYVGVSVLVLLVLFACYGYRDGYDDGVAEGRREVQRERLTERGCEQIAREPELWECDGERVEVKP